MPTSDKRKRALRLPQQIEWAVRAAEDKKATDIAVLDLRNSAGFTDYFVIGSGQNPRQIRAIADAVLDVLASHGATPAHVEGYDGSEWILLDYFDFIVHVFVTKTRVFYDLDRLWGDAERLNVPPPTRPAGATGG